MTLKDLNLNKKYAPINKFGRTGAASNGVNSDVWDYSETQAEWVAPTAARIHAIASDSTNDNGSGSNGAQTVNVFGLTSWTQDGAETSETVTLNGSASVNTANQYVIIHRMVVATMGSATNMNQGGITATAATDSTVTAFIATNEGQTQMAILGVPEGRSLIVNSIHGGTLGAAATASDFRLVVNQFVNSGVTNANRQFIVKDQFSTRGGGKSWTGKKLDPPSAFTGPLIAKLRVNPTIDGVQIGGMDCFRPYVGLYE